MSGTTVLSPISFEFGNEGAAGVFATLVGVHILKLSIVLRFPPGSVPFVSTSGLVLSFHEVNVRETRIIVGERDEITSST